MCNNCKTICFIRKVEKTCISHIQSSLSQQKHISAIGKKREVKMIGGSGDRSLFSDLDSAGSLHLLGGLWFWIHYIARSRFMHYTFFNVIQLPYFIRSARIGLSWCNVLWGNLLYIVIYFHAICLELFPWLKYFIFWMVCKTPIYFLLSELNYMVDFTAVLLCS